ncbi:MAG: FkbM family methyltransferase [Verrucomicrobiota bacterium]
MPQTLRQCIRTLYLRYRHYYLLAWKLCTGRLHVLSAAYSHRIYFSQFGEDTFIEHYFEQKPKGFYIDVGAFHPYLYSNTCYLYQSGWDGINIEPNPMSFKLFEKYRVDQINLNLAISSEMGEAVFNCSEEFSGLENDDYIFYGRRRENQCTVNTAPLSSILDQHLPPNVDLDFLNIDCEGHDLNVLKTNDWDKYRPALIFVEEHEQGESKVTEYLMAQEYKKLTRLGFTLVFEDQKLK